MSSRIGDMITKYTIDNNKKNLGDSDIAILIKITESQAGKQEGWVKLAEAIKKVTGANVTSTQLFQYNRRRKSSVFKKFDKPFKERDLQKNPSNDEFVGPIEELEARELHKQLPFHNPHK